MGKLRIAVGVALAACGVGLDAFAGTALDYLQDHLIAQYDAVENAGRGRHDIAPAAWKDLVGDHDLVPTGDITFGGTAVSITEKSQRFEIEFPEFVTAVANNNATIEIRFTPRARQDGSTLFTLGYGSNRFLGVYCWNNNIYDGIMIRDGFGTSSGCPNVANDVDHTATFVVKRPAEGQLPRVYVYHDGVLKYNKQEQGPTTPVNQVFSVGKSGSTGLSYDDPSLIMDIESIRVYDVALTDEQIAANAAVDIDRFVNGNIGEIPGLTVAGDPDFVPGAEPAYGVYYESGTYSVKPIGRGSDGHVYRCTGYSIAEKTGGAWGAEEEHPGELAYEYDFSCGKVLRLTWKWTLAPDLDFPVFEYRPITVVNAEAVAAGEADRAELAFAADGMDRDPSTVDKLYILYGNSTYGGDDVTQYDNFAFVADVTAETLSGTYTLPAGFGTDYQRFRFFLVADTVNPSGLYLNSHLISQWDAVDNAGRGTHVENPAVWTDLKGNHDLTPEGEVVFGEKAVCLSDYTQRLYNGSCADFISAVGTDQKFTLEIRFTPRSNANGDYLFALGFNDTCSLRFLGIYAWSWNIYDGIMYRHTSGTSSGCSAVAVGKQHTMSIVVNGGEASVYHDGVIKQSRSSGGCAAGSELFSLGRYADVSDARSLSMDICSVRAYACTLSEFQMASNLAVDQRRFVSDQPITGALCFSDTVVSDATAGFWAYDPVAGTMANGEWVLKVAARGGTRLAITGYDQNSLKTMDLKKPVFDGEGTAYSVVEIADSAFNETAAFDLVKRGKAGDKGATAGNPVLVKWPTTLEKIGFKAFCHATYMLVDEFLPESVTNIGDYAFYSCVSITNDLRLGFAGKDVKLGGYAFSSKVDEFGQMKIPTIRLGPGVKVIPEVCFNQNGAREIELPETIEIIGREAFSCTQDAWIHPTFPASLTNIGSQAFYDCRGMTNAIVLGTAGKHVSVGWGAFMTVTQSAGPMTYKSVTFGEGVTELLKQVCYYADQMTNMTFTTAVTAIGEQAFMYCHLPAGCVFDIGTNTTIASLAFACYRPESSHPCTFKFHGYRADYAGNAFDKWDGKKLCIYLPRTEPGWMEAIDGKVTPWKDCDQALFTANFPNAKRPVGQLNAPVGLLNSGAWIVLWTPPEAKKGTMLIVR